MKYSLSVTIALLVGATTMACGDDDGGSETPDSGTATEETDGTTSDGEPTDGDATDVGGTDTEATDGAPTDAEGTDVGGTDQMDAATSSFMLESPNFDDGDALPDDYTCEGKPFGEGISPELNWSGAPDDTMSYALVFKDTSLADQPRFGWHYAVWNIPASILGIPEGLSVGQFPEELDGAEQFRPGPPGFEPSYFGPCPSWQTLPCFGMDRTTDSYEFTLYAFEEEELEVPEFSGDTDNSNWVYELELFFEELAIDVATLAATSDAAPTEGPMCVIEDAGAGDGGMSDAGGAGDGGVSEGDAGDASTN